MGFGLFWKEEWSKELQNEQVQWQIADSGLAELSFPPLASLGLAGCRLGAARVFRSQAAALAPSGLEL